MRRCLVVEDDALVRRFFAQALADIPDLAVDVAVDGREGLALVRQRAYDAILADIMMPELSGLDFLKTLKAEQPAAEVVLVTGYGTVERAIEAMKGGAAEFLEKPVSVEMLHLVVRRCLERSALRQEVARLRGAAQAAEGMGRLVGRSQAMQRVFALIRTLADVDAPVLVVGEPGTGKALVARELHERSDRRGGPFVTASCGAVPEALLERDLFRRGGTLDAALGGTLFLDEIGDTGPTVQHGLVHLLKEGRADVRIVAATRHDPETLVREGRLREDLFYRVKGLAVRIPPLRERSEDVPLLAAHFLARFAERFGKPITGIAPAALATLVSHPWPGNVRELEHAIEHAVIMAAGTELTEIPVARRPDGPALPGSDGFTVDLTLPLDQVRRLALERVESAYLRGLLTVHRGRLAAVARAARINERTLYEKMRQYGLRKEDFRGAAGEDA
ncbi:MAG TPA: sigma-54 dependent transcriptional regulator [Thermodesulfobacteriota bacterium]